ncbi:hypothetical protein F3059_01105 [Salibacter halophilus]|uniref:Uncharacterized protein n=2 Tax=Salibacter halophilus TaxID=1803916 RepID=A0A6N6MC19_9FLAO|nr:hypothetical protein F3059_01105 [Salibacter halophilus]
MADASDDAKDKMKMQKTKIENEIEELDAKIKEVKASGETEFTEMKNETEEFLKKTKMDLKDAWNEMTEGEDK